MGSGSEFWVRWVRKGSICQQKTRVGGALQIRFPTRTHRTHRTQHAIGLIRPSICKHMPASGRLRELRERGET